MFCICMASYSANINANSVSGQWHKFQETIMGTSTSVELFTETREKAERCSQLVFADMRRIDSLMSPYIKDSELFQINKLAGTQPVKISAELFLLIQRSIKFSELTDGAFDITFASIGYLYNYRENKRPSESQVNKLLSAIDYRNIILDPLQQSISFSHKNTKIDLGGIAKGHAVDKAIERLKGCHVENALVSAGGDTRILGDKNGRPWMMGIRHPRDKQKIVVSLPLKNDAISTSGDYERYFIENNKRYHHIIQPSTGKPASQSWSVSVLAKDSLTSDALSTALFIMGTEKAMKLINSLKHTEAIVINNSGKMFYSHGLTSPALTPPKLH